jgi:hypothetical protein
MKPLQGKRKLQFIASFGVVMVICCAFYPSSAQEFLFEGNRKKSSIKFRLMKNLIIIPLYVNNKGPFNFILDSGVSPLVVTDAAITVSLRLKHLKPTTIVGLGQGPEIQAFTTNELSVQIGKAKFDYIPTIILKDDFLGLSNYVGLKIHGLVGYYFYNSFIVNINYSTQSLSFRLVNPKKKIKGESIPFELMFNKPYITVGVEIAGSSFMAAKVLVDNGAGHAISLEKWEDRPFPLPKEVIDASLGNGLSGPISGKIGRLSKLTIGGFTFKDVIASLPIYEDAAAKTLLLNRNGNLGADLLSRFNTTFDYKNRKLYLSKNVFFSRSFDHDMSGLEVFTDETKKKRFFVMRIETKSPAEASGVEINDEILAINMAATEKMDLDEITRLLRSGDGRNVMLTLSRKGELLFKLIKLKRRI